MASNADLIISAEAARTEIKTALKAKNPSLTAIEGLLSSYRTICETFIFQTPDLDLPQSITKDLWTTHTQIKEHYRKQFKRFRPCKGRKKWVEQRKLGERYVHFIKSSQKFYRTLIRQLAARNPEASEVVCLAQDLCFKGQFKAAQHERSTTARGTVPAVRSHVQPNPDPRSRMIEICYDSLIYLGDLSRYRESEFPKAKTCNWGPARDYYDRATALLPIQSLSWRGLVAISNAEGDLFGALYNIYRSLCVPHPFPGGQINLDVLCERLSRSDVPAHQAQSENSIAHSLITYVPKLHASCYLGGPTGRHAELEALTLTIIAAALKEKRLQKLIGQVCLSIIAAEHLARKRHQEKPYLHDREDTPFRQINIKIFTVLLQTLTSELDALSTSPAEDIQGSSQSLTLIIEDCLPNLRQYSSWLTANIHSPGQDWTGIDTVYVDNFWTTYSRTLTALIRRLPIASHPRVEYLLDEDVETLCFTPFAGKENRARYVKADGIPKPHPPRETSTDCRSEMLARMTDLVQDGIRLSLLVSCPIKFHDTSFEYRVVKGNHEPGKASKTTSPQLAGDTASRPGTRHQLHSGNDDTLKGKEIELRRESIPLDVHNDTTMHDIVYSSALDEADQDLVVAPLHQPTSENASIPTIAGKDTPTVCAASIKQSQFGNTPGQSTQTKTINTHLHSRNHNTMFHSTFASNTSSAPITPRPANRLPTASYSNKRRRQQYQPSLPDVDPIPSSAAHFQTDILHQTHQLQAQSSQVHEPPDISSLSSYTGTPVSRMRVTKKGMEFNRPGPDRLMETLSDSEDEVQEPRDDKGEPRLDSDGDELPGNISAAKAGYMADEDVEGAGYGQTPTSGQLG